MAEQRGLKALETWAKKVTSGYSGVNVRDMTSSFRDGLAFCAIIHHYYPELIDFDSLSKENILHNNSLAFSLAEKKLGVPALLDAEDMVNYAVPDRLSIATYLSQLRNCFENQNRVNKLKPAVKRVLKEGQSGPPAKFLGDSRNFTPRAQETCQVCKHRVFLLERLMISGKLYHRTCFKCSKCSSLLKPGAYIESDVTGTYECAVCPDNEKKEQELRTDDKSISDNDMSNGVNMSSENTLTVSPLPPHRQPVLSVKFNNARNDFLQKSISEKHPDMDQNMSPSSKSSSSSNESLSGASDNQTYEDSPQNLDSGFKDESASEDLPCEVPKILSKGDEKCDIRKPFPSTPIRQLGLRTDSEHSNVHKPYQSIFTRELLHTTSLKTLSSSRSIEATSPSGLKMVSNNRLSADIPLIRSTSYTSASSLSPNSFNNLDTKTSFSLLKTKESFYTSSDLSHKLDNSLRRSSLGSSGRDNYDVSKLSEGALSKHRSDLNVSSLRFPAASLGNKVSEETSEIEPKVKTSSFEKPKEEFVSGTSVRQLIQLREASIQDSKLPFSMYRPQSILETDKSHEIVQDNKSSTPVPTKDSLEGDIRKNSEVGDIGRNSEIANIGRNSETADIGRNSETDNIDRNSEVVDIDKNSEDPEVNVLEYSESIQMPTNEVIVPKSRSKSRSHSENNKSSDNECMSAVLISDEQDFSSPFEVQVKEKNESISQTSVPDVKGDDEYPDDLNPFGDDEDAIKSPESEVYPDSLNPFGDDDENEVVQKKINVSVQISSYDETKNPFASDTDEEADHMAKPRTPQISRTPPKPPVPTSVPTKSSPSQQTFSSKSNTVSPTGSVRSTLKKRQAPKPPHVKDLFLNTSLGSQSSLSTLGSASPSKLSPSPKIRKNKRAPPPPSPSMSDRHTPSGKDVKSLNSAGLKTKSPGSSSIDQKSPAVCENDSSGANWKKKKRPAPPVPIPQRREIKKIPLHEIQAEMNDIEEKQMELENQGRELEVLIRDRDKDEEPTVEEEEYIMQLFELVNQKNALFRRQAELMYIKRSQRLEEEQVDLEFQFRCLMNKPESQKTAEDKAREEKLVQQLLDVVDQRNEIVDSIEMDRRREAEEDVSVNEQMEIKTGDLPITAEIKQKSEKKHKKNKKEKKKKKNKELASTEKHESEVLEKKGTIRKKWF